MAEWYGYMHKRLTENDKIEFLAQQLKFANRKFKKPHSSFEIKWYSFLKKRKLFQKYVNRINEICVVFGFSRLYFDVRDTNKLKCTCQLIDEFISGNGTYRWWQNLYDEFMFEENKVNINHIMSARLYMVNQKKIRHSKYIGRNELKKSIYDTLVDSFFRLFTK